MTLAITDDHLALQAVARRFLADRCPPAVVRAAMDDPSALPPFWAELVGLEWLTLDLPELAVVLEELGRAAAPGPFLPTVWARTARKRHRQSFFFLRVSMSAFWIAPPVRTRLPPRGAGSWSFLGMVNRSQSVGPMVGGDPPNSNPRSALQRPGAPT